MRDFAPEEKILRDRVLDLLKNVFERYGFSPLETPIIERWEVLSAKYAGGEEILKETYKFTDQGERELGLRYDLTTPLARFVGMNPTIKRPFKRYHIGTVYRDGPIKLGRYREFYQCDVDTVGVSSMMADAELILIACDVFRELGFTFEIRTNHRQLLKDVAEFAKVPAELIDTGILSIDKLEKIGAEGVRKEMLEKGISEDSTNAWLTTLDISGSNAEMLASIQEVIPKSQGAQLLAELFELTEGTAEVRFLPSLARGLGYYTGTIFEAYSSEPKFDGAVAGGGRYDNLISDFLERKEPYPATGISFGLEPICELLKMQEEKLAKTVTQVYVLPIGVKKEGLEIAQKLRKAGINTGMDLAGKGVSANMKYANAYEIPYVVIVGQNELDEGKVNLKHMESGEERLLTLDEVVVRMLGTL
jgi:histidyl-tRNA synthetase